jgi:3-methyladenine DNA glycosylase AlkD
MTGHATRPQPAEYRLRVAGHLDHYWSPWFGDLTLTHEDDGTTTLSGPVADQAQLHGLLLKVRDRGITLISVEALDGRGVAPRRRSNRATLGAARSATRRPRPMTGATPGQRLVVAIRGALPPHADPARAAAQQRYMKSALPYLGLTSPTLRVALRPLLADPAYQLTDRSDWEAGIRALVDQATYREHWYAAVALARHRSYRAWRDPQAVPLYRHLVEATAWWDVVDEVASHLVGEVLLGWPETEAPRLRGWAREESMWVRRTAILAQIGATDRTDVRLLHDVIEPNIGDREFFVRKAIGWALRSYARTDPGWVRAFVQAHPGLSGLSRREALKHL